MAIATINPSTGQLIQSFESLTGAEIDAKLQRAAQTFRATATSRCPSGLGGCSRPP